MQADAFANLDDIRGPATANSGRNPWMYPTHAAVGPRGEIIYRHFNSHQEAAGDMPIASVSGMPVIDPRYRARGWVMYEDLCNGIERRRDGTQIEGDAKALERWRNLIKLRAAGHDIPPGVLPHEDAFWHPEVARRRQLAPGFAGATDMGKAVEQLRTMFPGVEIVDPSVKKKPDKTAKS